MQDTTAIRENLDAAQAQLGNYDAAIQQVKDNKELDEAVRDTIVTSLSKDREGVHGQVNGLSQQVEIADALAPYIEQHEAGFEALSELFPDTRDTHVLTIITRVSPDGIKTEADFARRGTARSSTNGKAGQTLEDDWGTFEPGQSVIVASGPSHVGEEFSSLGAAYSAIHEPRKNGQNATAGLPQAVSWFRSNKYTLRPS